jgi:polysaccharide pyruvyl transferase CsaB
VKVLLSGYYGFGNLGDEALLAGLIQELKVRGHRVTVLSRRPELTRELHGVPARHRTRDVLPALLRCDALISGGGGLLQDRTSRRSLRYYLGVIRLAKILGKRVIVYGQSVGPLTDAGKRSVAAALRNVPIAVRDEGSRTLLTSLGLESYLTADAALLLPPVPSADDPGAPVLLIPRGGYPEITQGLSELAVRLATKGVCLAGLALQPEEDDTALREIQRAAPIERWNAPTPAEALGAVVKAGYVVSGRLHGLIFALLERKGCSGLVYDPKVAAFLREAGRREHPLPVNVDALLAEVLEHPALAEDRVQALEARARQGLEWLEQMIQA